jgi:hypothetical protein
VLFAAVLTRGAENQVEEEEDAELARVAEQVVDAALRRVRPRSAEEVNVAGVLARVEEAAFEDAGARNMV